jgi:hypothetical protein
MQRIIDAIGWYGVFAAFGAYALVGLQILQPGSQIFLILIASAALGVMIASLRQKAWQAALLSLIWMVVSIATLLRAP